MRPGNVHRFAPYLRRLQRTAVRKLRGAPAPADPLNAVVLRGYRSAVEGLRRDGVLDAETMQSSGLYDRGRLTEFLDASRHEHFDRWTLLGRIATVELAYRSSGTGL